MTEADTACALACGDVPVLSTPAVVGLCERATIDALGGLLRPGQTSVGARVEVAHLTPVAVGSSVQASAVLERSEGRRLIFAVSVTDACGLVAAGRVTRIIVERDHFVGKAR